MEISVMSLTIKLTGIILYRLRLLMEKDRHSLVNIVTRQLQ